MPRKYPYYPSFNGKQASPVTVWFVKAMNRRWGFTNMGIYSNRTMKNPKAIEGDPKWLSVHATGWACDIGYTDRKVALIAWDWLIAHTKELRIAEIHDYAYKAPGATKAWGRSYRCSRGEGVKGVKVQDGPALGSPGGKWLHVEIENSWKSAEEFQAAWKAIPKP